MTPQEEIGHFADVPVEFEAVLDRKLVQTRELLNWRENTLIWLTRSAGENIDIYAGGTLFGFGEIVVIENKFGVRITDFYSEA
jgi:flagellar motor switch protein FliN/FliY